MKHNRLLLVTAWLYTTLMLAERRAGLVILLIFSIGAAAVPVLHMTGAGMAGGRIAGSSGILFWAWTLIAMGVTGLLSIVLVGHAFRDLQAKARHARMPA